MHRPGKLLVIPDTLSQAHKVQYEEEDKQQTSVEQVFEKLGIPWCNGASTRLTKPAAQLDKTPIGSDHMGNTGDQIFAQSPAEGRLDTTVGVGQLATRKNVLPNGRALHGSASHPSQACGKATGEASSRKTDRSSTDGSTSVQFIDNCTTMGQLQLASVETSGETSHKCMPQSDLDIDMRVRSLPPLVAACGLTKNSQQMEPSIASQRKGTN